MTSNQTCHPTIYQKRQPLTWINGLWLVKYFNRLQVQRLKKNQNNDIQREETVSTHHVHPLWFVSLKLYSRWSSRLCLRFNYERTVKSILKPLIETKSITDVHTPSLHGWKWNVCWLAEFRLDLIMHCVWKIIRKRSRTVFPQLNGQCGRNTTRLLCWIVLERERFYTISKLSSALQFKWTVNLLTFTELKPNYKATQQQPKRWRNKAMIKDSPVGCSTFKGIEKSSLRTILTYLVQRSCKPVNT